MRPVVTGTRLRHEYLPGAGDTAAAIGNDGVEVVSTPVLIGYMEHTCHLMLEPGYEEGEATVGTHVCVDHLAPGRVGTPVTVTAELVSTQGRTLGFEAEVRQDGTLLMRGRHERRLVRIDRFAGSSADRPRRPAPGPASVAFWFDFNSPWCYLAASRIGDIGRRQGAGVAWRPVHLANLLDHMGGRRVLEENASFVAWYRRDLREWADIEGLTLDYHPDFPLRPSRALRASLYADDQGRGEAFVTRLMGAYWREAADITDTDLLASVADEAGIDGGAIPAIVSDPDYKARLDGNVEAAAEAGVFGLPSVVWDGKVFFGNDRLALLERALSRRARDA